MDLSVTVYIAQIIWSVAIQNEKCNTLIRLKLFNNIYGTSTVDQNDIGHLNYKRRIESKKVNLIRDVNSNL